MSGWLVATREVYNAGGSIPVGRMLSPPWAVAIARQKGVLEPMSHGGARNPWDPVRITPLGRQLLEGKLELYTPCTPSDNGGRAKGTHRRLRATWLASLPEGVRLAP